MTTSAWWGHRKALWLAAAGSAAGLFYDPLAPAATGKRVALLLVGVATLAWRSSREAECERGWAVPAAALWWLALVGWLAVSALRSLPLGLPALGTWVGGTAVLLAALRLPRHQVRLAARTAALMLGGGAALWAIAEYLRGARGLYVHGGQGNPNWLGLLLALTLPLAVEQAWRVRRRPGALALVAVVALQGAALYLSHSRVAWAAVAVAVLVAAWPVLRALTAARAALAGVLVIAVAVGAIDRASAQRESAALDEPATAEVHDAPLPVAWAGRVWIWRTSLHAAVHSLPFGVGLGGFAFAYLDAQGQRLAALSPRQAARRFLNATTAHDDWLEVAVDGGVVALLLLVAALGSAYRAHSSGESRRGRWDAGAAVLAALAVCATGDSPLQQPATLISVALVLAAAPRRVRLRGVAGRTPAALLAWPVLILAALLLAPATSAWLGARLSSAARTAALQERAALLTRAARIDPRSGEIALLRGLDALLLGDAAQARPELLRARALLANFGTDVALGNAELLLGQPADAVAAYERALSRHPGSFRAHANLAMALSQLGAYEQARAHLGTARALQPGHPKLAEMAQRIDEQARGAREPDVSLVP